jgi:hypothetical protein
VRVLFTAIIASLALIVSACSTKPRTGPPAPVYSRGVPAGPAQVSGVDEPSLETGEGALAEPVYDPDTLDTSVPVAPTQAPRAEVATSGTLAPTPPASQQIASASPATSSRPMSKAASSLMDKAEDQRRAGDLAGAAATLERAVRIDSRHPLLWNHLAQVRLQQGNYGLATELASKSNALAGSDRSVKRSNYLIIADAKRSSGDVAGARVAQSRADSLR